MSQPNIPAHVPEQFESERLIIRCPRVEDAAAVNAGVQASVEELYPWMAWAKSPCTIEEQAELLAAARQKYLERSDFRLLLFAKDTGAYIGSSGIHRMDWDVRKFELGYWVATPHAGRGYITEAVERITRFCIEEFHANRVEIRCDLLNTRSAAVAQRLNFPLEGILRNDDRGPEGELRDTMVFAKVRGSDY